MSANGWDIGDAARLEQSLIVGLLRSPEPSAVKLDGSGNSTLAALSLLGQRKRFSPVTPPQATLDPILPDDDRTVLPEAARRILRQLVAGNAAVTWDTLATAVFDRVHDGGYRFHPFDLPWLEKYLKDMRRNRRLGPTESAWLAYSEDRVTSQAAAGDIDDETWATFPKAERLDYLERRRSSDPATGRRLLEAHFAGEPANLRAHLLGGLKIGLGPDDRSFLEKALSDRAKSVREKAAAMLGRLPGTELYAARLADGLEAVRVKTSGLVNRRRRLSYRPKQRRAGDPLAAFEAVELLAGITLAEFADRFDIPPDGLLAAAADDNPLLCALLKNAASEGRWDLILEAAGSGDIGWADVVGSVHEPLALLPAEQRRDFVARLFAIGGLERVDHSVELGWLYESLGEPLGDREADVLLADPSWKALIAKLPDKQENSDEFQSLRSIAALVPASRSQRFLADVEPLPREIKLRPMLYHQFVAALDAPKSSQEQDVIP